MENLNRLLQGIKLITVVTPIKKTQYRGITNNKSVY